MADKLEAIHGWLEPLLAAHKQSHENEPFVLAISGVQGSGKSTLVMQLEQDLVARHYRVAQVSLDDLYKTFPEQTRLAHDSGVALWQSRGQFGTHDLELARNVFSDLRAARAADNVVAIPRYDKSLFSGRGDRLPVDQWSTVTGLLDVTILEGWGVGFQAVSEDELKQLHARAQNTDSQVGKNTYKDIMAVNGALHEYNQVFMGPQHFHALVVLQAEETEYVYDWRLEQEHAMWKIKNSGMTDAEVKAFIDRYYPSYELYLPRLLQGVFGRDKLGHQINLKMDRMRALRGSDII